MANRREFIKRIGAGAVGLGLVPFAARCSSAPEQAPVPRSSTLPRSAPGAQGVSAAGLSSFLEAVAGSGLEFHSIMVLRHGHVVAEGWWEPYAPSYRHTLYSLSKSFTSTAVGFAVADGRLTIDDSVLSFFPDLAPVTASDQLAAMRVRHLLTMTTGHAADTMPALREASGSWPAAFFGLDVPHEPGTHFLYNTGASYMLSAIVQRVMGLSVHQLLVERLFRPLAIEGTDWETDPAGVSLGGYGLRLRTEDIAKFGQLYLARGQWFGAQILPAAWVDEATSRQTDSQAGDNDWSQGYGYQFWRCRPAPGFYRGDGAFGQFCIVIPQYDAVVVVTSESSDMQGSMNLVWDHVLPAVGGASAAGDPAASGDDGLVASLADLSLPRPAGARESARAAAIDGRTYQLDANDQGVRTLRLSFAPGTCTLDLETAAGPRQVVCGFDSWVEADNARRDAADLFPVDRRTNVPTRLAAAAAWTGPDTLSLRWQYVENAHHDEITCAFEGDRVAVTFANSALRINGEPDPRAALTGRLA